MNNLGSRMKNNYESRSRNFLTRRVPVILRLDGKAFHTFTRNFDKPFDNELSHCLEYACKKLAFHIQGAKCAYIQSDEVSYLITDMDRLNTESWFNYNVQKMCSVASSIFTANFNFVMSKTPHLAYFDARVFNIPKEEVVNYFVWRHKDWVRNSVQMLTRHYYSHNDCIDKDISDMHEMLYHKGVNWVNLDNEWKNGNFLRFDGKKSLTPSNFNDIREDIEQMIELKG